MRAIDGERGREGQRERQSTIYTAKSRNGIDNRERKWSGVTLVVLLPKVAIWAN